MRMASARLNRRVEPVLAELLERQREGTPTLLWVHYVDPHAPYTPVRGARRFVDDPWYDPSASVAIDNRRMKLLPIDSTLEPIERRRRVAFNRPSLTMS